MSYNENDYWLYHSGIKGMHWGIRRYQNYDGTYTDAGKARRNKNSPGSNEDKQVSYKKAVAIGVASAAATLAVAGGAMYLYKHRESIRDKLFEPKVILNKYGSTSADEILEFSAQQKSNVAKAIDSAIDTVKQKAPDIASSVKDYAVKKAGQVVARAEKASGKIVDQFIDGLIATAGTYAITKLVEKKKEIKAGKDSVASKVIKEEALQVTIDTIRDTTNARGQSSQTQNSSTSGSASDTFKAGIDALGEPPAKIPIDKSSDAWSSLFKKSDGSLRSDSERKAIKELAAQGYSISQIQSIIYKTEGN